MPINKKLYSNLKKLYELQRIAKKYKVMVTKKTNNNKLKYKTITELSNEIKKVKSKLNKNSKKINKKNKQ